MWLDTDYKKLHTPLHALKAYKGNTDKAALEANGEVDSFVVTLLSLAVWPVVHQVHSLFQSLFSTECDLVLPLSISSILLFPEGHPVAAYFFFLVFPSLISFTLSFNNMF
jgi:Sec-independent protein secretion pathway component TatC